MILNETILNVFVNYVLHKYIIIDNKEPVQVNKTIKSNIKTINKLSKQYIDSDRFESDFDFDFETVIAANNDSLTSAKDLYYKNLAKILNTPVLQAKTSG